MFGQVACTQSEDELDAKNLWGLFVACLGVAICLIIRFTAIWMRNLDMINEKLLQTRTATVSDYSISGVISPEAFRTFKAYHRDSDGEQDRRMVAFRDSLAELIERSL